MAISREFRSFLAAVARQAANAQSVSYSQLYLQANGVKLYGLRIRAGGLSAQGVELVATLTIALEGLGCLVRIGQNYSGSTSIWIRPLPHLAYN